MSLTTRRRTCVTQVAVLALAVLVAALGCEAEDAPCADTHAAPGMAVIPAAPAERALRPTVLVRVMPSHDADPVMEGDKIQLRWDGDPGVVYAITEAGHFLLAGRGPERWFTAMQASFVLEWDDCGATTVTFLHFRPRREPS